MVNHFFALFAIILTAGVFGGLLNYYMLAQLDSDSTSMPRSIIGGLAGAALVPLVLYLVSSDLMTLSQDDPSRMLIFGGYCLIAAWASRFVMTTITDRIVRDASIAREQANEVMVELRLLQRELEPMFDMETEEDTIEEELSAPLAPEEDLDVTTGNVLTALGNGRYIFRSLNGLCAETELDEHTLNKTLGIIVARDLGGKVLGKKGMRWFITQKGRKYLSASA
jgi:hypothetical protein